MKRCLKLEIALQGLIFCASGCGSEQPVVRSVAPGGATEDAGVRDAALPTAPDASAECGNGLRELDEACDDGNLEDGDGCDAHCEPEPPRTCWVHAVELQLQADGSYLAQVSERTTDRVHTGFGSCGGSGPEYAINFQAKASGKLDLTLTADFDTVLYVRSSCLDEASELGCAQEQPWGISERLSLEVVRDQEVFVFVDGIGREAGSFDLTLRLTPQVCLDGVLGPLENCEDGNLEDGDGCSSGCRIEGNPGTCPGAPLRVGAASVQAPVLVRGNTEGLGSAHQPLQCSAPTYVSEAIYAFEAEYDGSLQVELTKSEHRHVLYLRSSCAEPSSQLTCAEKREESAELAALRVPVREKESVTLFVDSARPLVTGPFELAVRLLPARCGNAYVDPNEECDDGNDVLGDGCEACVITSAASDDVCPGLALPLKQESAARWQAQWTGSTRQKIGNFQSHGPGLCAERSARDVVYRISPPKTGVLSAQLHSDFDASLSLRTLCGIEAAVAQPNLSLEEAAAIRATELLCVNAVLGSGTEAFERVPVVEGRDVFVIVDAKLSSASGTFALSVQFEAEEGAE